MSAGYKAAVTAITVTTDKGDYVVMGAQDPRWRIDKDGKFDGIDAMDAQGNLVKLPLQPGFVGGKIEGGMFGREGAAHAALREIKEEAGMRMYERVRQAGLRKIYVAERKKPDDPPETTYFHAHLAMPLDALKECLKLSTLDPENDTVALMLVKPEQVEFRKGQGYVMRGVPAFIHYRGYIPTVIPKDASATQRAIIEKYNARGQTEALVGIDTNSLTSEPLLYTPPGCPQDAPIDPAATIGKGGHSSNGAILKHVVEPRLKDIKAGVSTGAALAV